MPSIAPLNHQPSDSSTASPPVKRQVLVCHGSACLRSRSASVLQAFEQSCSGDFKVESCGCLGQCGNGPMVLVLPEEIWYDRVRSSEVAAIVEQHLHGGQPVQPLLYQKFHS